MHHFLPRALPEGLEALTELALDVRWTWSHAGDALWRNLGPQVWELTRNPWAILQNVPQARLEALAKDPEFLEALRRAVDDRARYQSEPGWYARERPDASVRTVAYFSMEFGLSEAFPLYAGGLGILAGDYLKTASDLDVPAIGVGLLYQEGYFRQLIGADGRQQEAYPYNNPTDLPIQPVMDREGVWLRVGLTLPGRTLHLRVWQANVGRVRLYLLDSNDLLNGPADRGVTAKLYGGGIEMRLMQEMALGIGGWAMLRALGVEADVCHLNEGHAAFAVLERAREFMETNRLSFREAWWATRAGNVFTSHTPVAAGFDLFPDAMMRKYFGTYAAELGISMADLLALGRENTGDDEEPFNMAYLALRGCSAVNAVSRLHAQVSRRLFRALYPGWPEGEIPVGHVTNGVHVPSWDSPWADRLWTRVCGKGRWLGATGRLTAAVQAIGDDELWVLAAEERRALVRYARERLAWQLSQRGASADAVADASRAFDPNILTVGFARRFAEYKRPNLLLHDPERLARLLLDGQRPVQIIVAGKAHPDDEQGKRLVHEWLEFVNRPDVRARAVFLEDYDMALAQELVQGVDLWINTPRRPWEACGTSGMKVLANGGLNASTLDGWWAEAYAPEAGWAIGDDEEGASRDDAADAERLYRLLEQEIAPMFYERDERGIPRAWIGRMRASISRLAPQFSSNRMLQDYLDRLYVPAAAAYRHRSKNRGAIASSLQAWYARVLARWGEIHFGPLDAGQRDGEWRFKVLVYLGELPVEWVKVELYADPLRDEPAVRQPMLRGERIPGAANGYVFTASVSSSRPPAHFTPRVTAWHPEAVVPVEAPLIAWQR
ncbi:MAG: alpha-glucan family phosphorylase [Sphingomonadaceae bacterium]